MAQNDRIGTREPDRHIGTGGRAEDKLFDPDERVGKFGRQITIQSIGHSRDRLGVGHTNDKLAIAGICLLRVVCQHESARAAPHQGRHVGHLVFRQDQLFEPFHFTVGDVDVGPLRHLEFDIEKRGI